MKRSFSALVLMSFTVIALAACSNSSSGKNGAGGAPGDQGQGGPAENPRPNQPAQNQPVGAQPAAISCVVRDNTGLTYCIEQAAGALTRDQIGQQQQTCGQQGGAFAVTACTPAGHFGTCALVDQGQPLKVRFYQPLTADQQQGVQNFCAQKQGQFSRNY